MRNFGQISLRFYIRGEHAPRRAENLKALARKLYPTADGRGNFSEMVNDVFNKFFNLDPETGEPLQKSGKCPTGAPKRR